MQEHLMSHAEAIEHRHFNVEQNAIGKRPRVQRLQPVLAVISRLDRVPRQLQKLRRDFDGIRIVIDDEYVCQWFESPLGNVDGLGGAQAVEIR
jgi:hypothetical protein